MAIPIKTLKLPIKNTTTGTVTETEYSFVTPDDIAQLKKGDFTDTGIDTSFIKTTYNGATVQLTPENLSTLKGLSESDIESYIDQLAAFIGYTDEDIMGVIVDYENKTYQRVAGAANLSAGAPFNANGVFGGRRRCTVANDGTVIAYFGETGFVEDGSNGQVMVEQPLVYYRVVPLKLEKQSSPGIGYHVRKAAYYVSAVPKKGFKVHPAFYNEDGDIVDKIYIGAYESSLFDTSANAYLKMDEQVINASEDLLCSISGVKPASGRSQQFTRPNVEATAKNRGAGWHMLNIQIASLEQLLMLIEYAGNLQTLLATGITGISDSPNTSNNSSHTGSTSELGNASGVAQSTVNERNGTEYTYTAASQVAFSYRGVENEYGNIWKFVHGMNMWGNGAMNGGMPFICDDFNFAESKNSDNYKGAGFTATNANGYISAFGFGDAEYDWLFVASETAGNSSLPIGDYHYVTSNLNGFRMTSLGGSWTNGAAAGSFYWNLANGVGDRARNVGGRLVYVPRS